MKEFIEKLIKELETGIFSKDEIRNYNSSTQENMICQNKGIKYAIRKVNELAEEYKGGWIACSERLPEANQKVLTCDKDGWISVNVNMPYIGVRNDFECGYYVAWQPLPQPYKENENEN